MQSPKRTGRILVVDDDERMRDSARELLEREGFTIVEAQDGNEALRVFREQPADVVVCDLFMPGKDGLETIRELRAEFPRVKIIAVSGGGYQGRVDVLRVAKLFGATEILAKPFKPGELLKAVERWAPRA